MISVILLAAGSSRRMGNKNKLLLPINGVPMITHVAKNIMNSDIDHIIAIVGFQRELVEPRLSELSIETVYNPNYTSGMVSSVKCGVVNLPLETKKFMIVLGDMPLLRQFHYNALLKFIEKQKQGSIIRPISNNKEFGHPVIFDCRYVDEILKCSDPHSLKSVVNNNKTAFVRYHTTDSAYFTDTDTPSEYEKLIL